MFSLLSLVNLIIFHHSSFDLWQARSLCMQVVLSPVYTGVSHLACALISSCIGRSILYVPATMTVKK